MTIETIFSLIAASSTMIFVILILVPVGTFAISWIHGVYDGRRAPWRYIYGLVVQISTAAIVALGALFVLYVMEGGVLSDPVVPRAWAGYLAGSWFLSLLVVKRVVDFRHIPSVRNPLLLIMGWVFGWLAGGALYLSGLWLIPGPPLYTSIAAVLLVFGMFQMTMALFGSRR